MAKYLLKSLGTAPKEKPSLYPLFMKFLANTNYFSKVQGGVEDVIPMLNAMTAALADLEERVTALEPAEEPAEDPAATET